MADLITSVVQVHQQEGSETDDNDLTTILLEIYPEITTRKVLLVGHSQGTFYTNALYDYLTAHGVAKQSIAVYNIATPASYVSGGGKYLNSSTDTVIEKIRTLLESQFEGSDTNALDAYNAAQGMPIAIPPGWLPLPPNITIALTKAQSAEANPGHSISDVYLTDVPDRIVSDIRSELSTLSVPPGADSSGDCFTPPSPSTAYKSTKAAYAAGDALLSTIASAYASTKSALSQAVEAAGNFAFGWVPPANEETAVKAFPLVQALYGSSLDEEDVAELNGVNLPGSASDAPTPPPVTVPRLANLNAPPASVPKNISPMSQAPAVPLGAPQGISVSPGFGGGAPAAAIVSVPVSNASVIASPANLAFIFPLDGASLATTSVVVSGTADAGALVYVSAGSSVGTTTADSGGNWSLTLTLPEGVYTLSAAVFDTSTTTISRSLTIDTTPPAAPSLSALECADSISASSCLLPQENATLAWGDIAGTAGYAIAQGGSWIGTTTATTSSVTILDGDTDDFSVVALDAAGNAATSSTVAIAAYLRPIVISEVGWAGTNASSSDQYIELKNRTSDSVDLSHMALETEDGAVYVPLSGSVTGSGYYVLARGDGSGLTAPHDLAVNFTPLSTSTAQQLLLAGNFGSGTTTLDETPAMGACGASWCAGAWQALTGFSVLTGNSLNSVSMERLDDAVDGSLASNWASNDMYSNNGSDRFGEPVNGTPGAPNSRHLGEDGFSCGTTEILTDASTSTYTPQSSTCTYYSRFIALNAQRYGALFEGEVGSSTLINANSLNKPLVNSGNGNVIPGGTPTGTPFFAAIFETPPTYPNAVADFESYFETGSTTAAVAAPPHDNYRVIPFVLGN